MSDLDNFKAELILLSSLEMDDRVKFRFSALVTTQAWEMSVLQPKVRVISKPV